MKDADVFFPKDWLIKDCLHWLVDRHVFLLGTHRTIHFGNKNRIDWFRWTYPGGSR